MSLNLGTAMASMYNCFDKDSQDAKVNDDHSLEDSNKFGAIKKYQYTMEDQVDQQKTLAQSQQ